MQIRFYQDKDQERWDKYVLNHPLGTFFHLIGWKQVIEKTFGHKSCYLIAEEATSSQQPATSNQHRASSNLNSIIGILPLFSIKSPLFAKSLVSIPFAAYGGILADNHEIALKLLNKAKEITCEKNLDYLELRHRDGNHFDLPTKDLYYTFRRKVYPDLDANMKAIPRKSRRMVRQGMKNNLSYRFGQEELLNSFYEIFARSYHRLGSPVFPFELFKNLIKEFKNKCNILIINTKEEKDIAAVMSFYYKDQIMPYYAGSLFEYRSLAPNDFMYWQLMKYGCEKGYKLFDFGRSKINTGSFDFKRHWGFKPTPLPYQYFLNGIKEIPNVSPANPKYQKWIKTWKKLPFWATKLIGSRIVKYIP